METKADSKTKAETGSSILLSRCVYDFQSMMLISFFLKIHRSLINRGLPFVMFPLTNQIFSVKFGNTYL